MGKFPPLIVIGFDDGFRTDYTVAYEYMKPLGIPGTVYYMPDWYGFARYLNWRQILEMKNDGWDFQCHFSYVGLSEQQLHAKFQEQEKFFSDRNLSLVHHAAHNTPNEHRDLGLAIVPQYRKTATVAGVPHALIDYADTDFYRIPRSSVDMLTASRLDQVKDTIDQTIAENKILIAYSHELVDNPGASTQSSIALFKGMIDYVVETGIQCVTISEMYRRMKMYREELVTQ